MGRSMARLQRRIVAPSGVPPPSGKYSHAVGVRASELLFIAGQTSRDDQGELIGVGDAAAQTRRAFELIGLVLSDAGADFSSVVEFTTYIVGRDSVTGFIEARSKLFDELFPEGDYPPNTLVNVESLGGSEALVEISAVAALP